jgi:hypothetical protein
VTRPARGSAELVPRTVASEIGPASMPLREGIRLRLRVDGAPDPRTGLYGDFGEGWDYLGGAISSDANVVGAESRRLGWFAALTDTMAPRLHVVRPRRRALPGPYSTWALEARIAENGSGLDTRNTGFVVDGRKVPSEWDGVRGVLRWRPRVAPAHGSHAWELEARDRAGNVRRSRGTFVIN